MSVPRVLLDLALRTFLRRTVQPRRRRRGRAFGGLGLLALLLGGGYYGGTQGWWPSLSQLLTRGAPAAPSAATSDGDAFASDVVQAIRAKRSQVWVTGEGRVERLLPDDSDGARHQCWIVRVAPEYTVKVAHNIEIAPRVPLEVGMRHSFRGEYVWNEQGGVLHWTHHDPDSRKPGGWVELAGKRYE